MGFLARKINPWFLMTRPMSIAAFHFSIFLAFLTSKAFWTVYVRLIQITKARSASLPGRGVASLDHKLQCCIRSSKCMFMTTKHFELAAGEGMPNASEKALGNQICSKLVKLKCLAMSCGCVAFGATKATLPGWPHPFQHSHLTTLLHCSTTTSRIIGVSKGILAQLIPAACAGGVECTDFCQARSNHKISQVLTFQPCMDLIICYVRYQNAQTEECLRMENAGETQGDVALVRDLSRDRSPCAECSAIASRRPCS